MNHCSISRKKEQRGDSIEGRRKERERRRREGEEEREGESREETREERKLSEASNLQR